MTDPIRELKVRAELLHGRAREGQPAALQRLRASTELKPLPDAALRTEVQRKHCLTAVARELGFSGWPHGLAALRGERVDDYGTLLYPPSPPYPNLWFRDHREAAEHHGRHGGYLLGYRRQALVVERNFIEALGLEPDDSDWTELGFDWIRPRSAAARTRLYGKLLAGLPREGA